MQSKKVLTVAALAGIAIGAGQPTIARAQESKEVKCYGVNSCKGHSGCSLTADDVSAVRNSLGEKDFKARFGKTKTHSCGAHASCGASSKILNWTSISEDSCQEKGGYIVEEQDGKKVAKKL
jgi:hypothetical protein